MKEILSKILALVSIFAAFGLGSKSYAQEITSKFCGLEGSVAERINDCSVQPDSKKEGFILVARVLRTEDPGSVIKNRFVEVYLEPSTNLIWSDIDPLKYMGGFRARLFCSQNIFEMAGIAGLTWRLPSIQDYEQAERNGIRKALPNMSAYFWTATDGPQGLFQIFEGYNGMAGFGDPIHQSFFTRCVASFNH